jgi:hypothetical protein
MIDVNPESEWTIATINITTPAPADFTRNGERAPQAEGDALAGRRNRYATGEDLARSVMPPSLRAGTCGVGPTVPVNRPITWETERNAAAAACAGRRHAARSAGAGEPGRHCRRRLAPWRQEALGDVETIDDRGAKHFGGTSGGISPT